jgi:hypothetical protein
MDLPLALEHAKTKKVSKDYFNKICNQIIGNTTGRATMMCGSYSCSILEKELAISLLKEKGYSISMSYNSHNVPYLIITW